LENRGLSAGLYAVAGRAKAVVSCMGMPLRLPQLSMIDLAPEDAGKSAHRAPRSGALMRAI
jgi:hypothetical protein